jgi:hypothetical protein
MANTIRFVVIILIFTFMAGFYIVPTRTMPDQALVLLDDRNKTYFSPQCAKNSAEKSLRPTTAAEARRLKYEPDQSCQGEAGFRQDGRSMSGNLLERLGMLPPLPSRWNPDGTWNW